MVVGFVGLGLIGGSIAKTFKKKHPDMHIMAYDEDQLTLLLAKQEGIIDQFVEEMTDYAPCDLVFLCVPVDMILPYAAALLDIVASHCILTDVGSTKVHILEGLADKDVHGQFIGGHPMAGSEKSGYEASTDFLLDNAFYLLTPTDRTGADNLATLKQLVLDLGALPIIVDAGAHDQATAKISHLPHVLASALVLNALHTGQKELCQTIAAGGFKDITRIASSSPDMWEAISFANKDCLVEEIDQLVLFLDRFKEHLAEEDHEAVFAYFDVAKELRDSLPNTRAKSYVHAYEVNLDVVDEPGIIARIATLLCDNGINIKNIGIKNNREHEAGILQILFYDEDSQLACEALLANHTW